MVLHALLVSEGWIGVSEFARFGKEHGKRPWERDTEMASQTHAGMPVSMPLAGCIEGWSISPALSPETQSVVGLGELFCFIISWLVGTWHEVSFFYILLEIFDWSWMRCIARRRKGEFCRLSSSLTPSKTGRIQGLASFCLCCVLFVFYFIIFFSSNLPSPSSQIVSHPPFSFVTISSTQFTSTSHLQHYEKHIQLTLTTFPLSLLSSLTLLSAFSRVLLLFFCNGLPVAAAAAAESEMLEHSHFGVAKDSYIRNIPQLQNFFFLFQIWQGGDRRSDGNQGTGGGRESGSNIWKKN